MRVIGQFQGGYLVHLTAEEVALVEHAPLSAMFDGATQDVAAWVQRSIDEQPLKPGQLRLVPGGLGHRSHRQGPQLAYPDPVRETSAAAEQLRHGFQPWPCHHHAPTRWERCRRVLWSPQARHLGWALLGAGSAALGGYLIHLVAAVR